MQVPTPTQSALWVEKVAPQGAKKLQSFSTDKKMAIFCNLFNLPSKNKFFSVITIRMPFFATLEPFPTNRKPSWQLTACLLERAFGKTLRRLESPHRACELFFNPSKYRLPHGESHKLIYNSNTVSTIYVSSLAFHSHSSSSPQISFILLCTDNSCPGKWPWWVRVCVYVKGKSKGGVLLLFQAAWPGFLFCSIKNPIFRS